MSMVHQRGGALLVELRQTLLNILYIRDVVIKITVHVAAKICHIYVQVDLELHHIVTAPSLHR